MFAQTAQHAGEPEDEKPREGKQQSGEVPPGRDHPRMPPPIDPPQEQEIDRQRKEKGHDDQEELLPLAPTRIVGTSCNQPVCYQSTARRRSPPPPPASPCRATDPAT